MVCSQKKEVHITAGPYDDIIDLPHHQSDKFPRMSMHQRAAQFAPFSALSGFGAAINDANRSTTPFATLDDTVIEEIDIVLQEIATRLQQKELPQIQCTYFEPDKTKSGGEYITITGQAAKLDRINSNIILTDSSEIFVPNISNIEIIATF